MKTAYFLLFFGLSYSTLAQDESSQDWIQVLSYGIDNPTNQTILSTQEVEKRKNHCLPEAFALADITLSNKKLIKDVKIKYDYKEHILIINQGGQMHVAAANMIKTVAFQDQSEFQTLINVSQMGRTYGRRGYYEVLLNLDKSFLLKYRSMDSKVLSDNRNMTGLETLGRTVADTTYTLRHEYLIYDKQSLYLLQSFKPKSLEELDKPTELLKTYIKKEKLKFKNEDHLRKFATYLWSL